MAKVRINDTRILYFTPEVFNDLFKNTNYCIIDGNKYYVKHCAISEKALIKSTGDIWLDKVFLEVTLSTEGFIDVDLERGEETANDE